MILDTSTEFGAMVAERLESEQCIWLTTVGPDGMPQPNPVWFLWEDDAILIYTQPASVKVRNIKANPNVSLNFNSTFDGNQVVVFTGVATFDDHASAVQDHPVFVEKYRQGLIDIQSSPETMGAEYDVVIRIKPEKVRGF